MNGCLRSCRISSWGALCPERERSLPLTGRSFKAKRQDDRWHQSWRSHGRADLELHFSNLEGRVIELPLYYFSNNKKKRKTITVFFFLRDEAEWWKIRSKSLWRLQRNAIKMHMHIHTHAKTFNWGFDSQIKCWRVHSAGCSPVIISSAQRYTWMYLPEGSSWLIILSRLLLEPLRWACLDFATSAQQRWFTCAWSDTTMIRLIGNTNTVPVWITVHPK